MPVERRGQVTRVDLGQLATGGTHRIGGRRQPSLGGTSRISREAYVRICEGLGVRFPGPTRRLTERNNSDGVPHDSRRRASARIPRQARLDAPGTPHQVILRGTRADGGRSRGPRKLPRTPRAVPRRHGAAARGLHVGNCEGGRESGATISPLSQQRPALLADGSLVASKSTGRCFLRLLGERRPRRSAGSGQRENGGARPSGGRLGGSRAGNSACDGVGCTGTCRPIPLLTGGKSGG